MNTVKARGIVDGEAQGPAMQTPAISFLGDIDIGTGCIVGDLPGVKGLSVKGQVLLMPYSRGSAGAWRFLYQLFKHGNHPAAIVTDDLPDPSLVQGAILVGVPIACAPKIKAADIAMSGEMLRIRVKDGEASIDKV